MLTTTRFGLNKPQTTDARSALRTALTTNADLLETALDLVTPTTVTALPTTSLFDGKLVYLQTTAMAAVGIRWLMRYRLSTTKWEYVGGAPWAFKTDVGESRGPAASATVLLLTTPPADRNGNSSSAVPAAGIYRVQLQMSAVCTGGTPDGVTVLAANQADPGATVSVESMPTWTDASGARPILADAETPDLAAGTLLRMGFRFWGATATYSLGYKRLVLSPILLHT